MGKSFLPKTPVNNELLKGMASSKARLKDLSNEVCFVTFRPEIAKS